MNKKKPLPNKQFFTRLLDQQTLQDVAGGQLNHPLPAGSTTVITCGGSVIVANPKTGASPG